MDAVISAAGAGYLAEGESPSYELDAELMRRCRSKDLAAFDQIVERYKDRIYGYVRRLLRDDAEAEDAAQEVFLKAFQGVGRYDGRAGLGTWLYRIATNICVDRVRRRERRPRTVPLSRSDPEGLRALELPDSRYDPEQSVLNNEMQQVVANAVDRLSHKLRTVLILHDTQGLSYEEIAQVVRAPLGTVKSRLFLAREHLRRALREYLEEGRNTT